ncbi:MAG: transcription elongation factor GreA [Angelakisella sp.]|jgi:transcription elongation factor GreA|nr:transcription elongation factor GreA [Angelakisella sp.]MCI9665641.1 transcription elongation factor GreA [Angelakisella sp.]
MAQEILLTAEGYEELKNELQQLKTVKRTELAEKIKTARGFGDLSENSEYDEAKNEQAIVEARILTLEEQLKVVRVVDRTALDKDVVNIGSVVKLLDCRFNEELEYRIVSSVEGGSASNTLTDKSPVGEAVMGHKAGETVEVHAPKGVFSLKILEIHN